MTPTCVPPGALNPLELDFTDYSFIVCKWPQVSLLVPPHNMAIAARKSGQEINLHVSDCARRPRLRCNVRVISAKIRANTFASLFLNPGKGANFAHTGLGIDS